MKSRIKQSAGMALVALGHITGTLLVAVIATLLIMPAQHAHGVVSMHQAIPGLMDMSTLAIAMHTALSACVWAFGVIVYKLVQLRIAERKADKTKVIKLSKGTIITETMVVMPVFLMLSMGMIQLAISNMAGILANVAIYEAARAGWVWMPEAEAGRMGADAGTAEQKCRIAVAYVMMPVAPGDFGDISFSLDPLDDDDFAKDARFLALGANVPLSGALSGLVDEDAVDILTALAATNWTPATRGNLNVARALDGNSAFWLRSVEKFTHAYQAAGCEIDANSHQVGMSYDLHVAMPWVRNIFGNELKTVGNRTGYFSTYERTMGFQKQVNAVNTADPNNEADAPSDPPDSIDAGGQSYDTGEPSTDDIQNDHCSDC